MSIHHLKRTKVALTPTLAAFPTAAIIPSPMIDLVSAQPINC